MYTNDHESCTEVQKCFYMHIYMMTVFDNNNNNETVNENYFICIACLCLIEIYIIYIGSHPSASVKCYQHCHYIVI